MTITNRPTGEDYYVAYTRSNYETSLAQIVHDLRRLADRLEREGQPSAEQPAYADGMGRYLYAAHGVQHSFIWAVANLGAHDLVRHGYQADQAERDAERDAEAKVRAIMGLWLGGV